MKFRNITIPAEGRNKYGNYVSSSELQKSVVRVTYNGNNTTGGNQPKPPKEDPRDVYTLILSRSTLNFEGKKLLADDIVETIDILGYVNSRRGDTFIGKIDTIPETDIYSNNAYYDMVGFAEGMSFTVKNNGTPNTQLEITCTSAATQSNQSSGTIIVPCSVYKKSGDESLGPYLTDWAAEKDECYTLYLELQWNVAAVPPDNAYTLDLTNEIAGINCDKDGNIYANAVKPTCKAIMYFGTEEVTGETYSISTPEDKNVVGLSIDTETGDLTFGSNFKFDGSTLEIRVSANYEGAIKTKIMTVVKQYAGQDGTPAVTRWVVPTSNVIKFNPNTNTVTPDKVTCKVMKQEGDSAPVEDKSTTLYYGWDTTNPTSVYSTEVAVDASKSYLAFALKNSNNVVYEFETIPIIKEGTNGSNGKDGSDGSNGQSVYRLALSNENASINADKDGNIYADAHKPTCTASLYYGASKVDNAKYSVATSPTATGVSINETTGVITLGSNFNFTGTSLEITVTAKIGTVIYGTSIMTISKSIAGADGVDGKDGTDGTNGKDGTNGSDAYSYWLDLSTTEVVVAKNSSVNPSSITLKAYQQKGGNTPTEITSASGVQIKWGYNTASPANTTKTISSINTSYNYIMVHLIIDSVIVDRQTIAILKDGTDGKNGEDGAQGRQGAALRGPVDWKSQTTSRRWCNGTLTNASYPEDAEFIDIVVYNGTYYKCTTSYNGKGSETTAPSSTYWTATDKQYEFVSTNLLLADNAKIKFSTNNELYLTDNNGNVTAGAAGGNGTSFWAGANEPTNAKFKVNYDGTMTATKGKFGLLEIGEDAWHDGRIFGTDTQTDGALSEISLQPQLFEMQALDGGTVRSNIRIAPYPDPDKYDMDGEIQVSLANTAKNGFFTNACVEAGGGFRNMVNGYYGFTPFAAVNNMLITFITDNSNLFTKSNGVWLFNGLPVAEKISAGSYPYIKVISGEWTACSSSSATSGYGTGIYSTAHSKQNNRLYIVI